MNVRRRRIFRIVIGVVCLCVIAFIWENSLEGVDISRARSGWVLQWVRPFLALFVPPKQINDHLVRKLAHFTEFFLLGALLAAYWRLILQRRMPRVLVSLCVGLAVASVDELLQFLSGRGPALADTALDFAGVTAGTFLCLACIGAVLCIRNALRARRAKTE